MGPEAAPPPPQAPGKTNNMTGETKHLSALAAFEEERRAAAVQVGEYGARNVDLSSYDPELVAAAVGMAREEGNRFFKAKQYAQALEMYTQAIAGVPSSESSLLGALLSNRSACHLQLGRHADALNDARCCAELRPDWAKAYYRLGNALAAGDRLGDAVAAFRRGAALDPDSADMRRRLGDTAAELDEHRDRMVAEVRFQRRDLVLKLRDARAEENRRAVLNQFKQGMSAPEWDVEDYEWRPTFLPAMRARPLETEDVERLRSVAGYVNAIAELEQPKRALAALDDACRCEAYHGAARAILPSARHVLVLDSGPGLLPLLAAEAGEATVSVVSRSGILQRMARQAIEGNRSSSNMGSSLRLYAAPFDSLRVGGPDDQDEAAEEEEEEDDDDRDDAGLRTCRTNRLVSRADAIVVDVFDHTGVGTGILRQLDHAAKHLLCVGAVVCPSRMVLKAQLVEFRLSAVSVLDLSSMNAYRWYPGAERVDLRTMLHETDHETYRALSEPFVVEDIDMQSRVDRVLAGAVPDASPTSAWELDAELDVEVNRMGTWNGVALWFELDLPGNETPLESTMHLDTGNRQSGSFGQALFYVDEIPVDPERQRHVPLRVQRYGAGHIVFTPDPPSCRARHALVPSWHYDMLLDGSRNDAYEKALGRAVRMKREFNPGRELLTVDLGAGTGILSMLAARAGSHRVVGAEQSAHMCDVGEECEVMNGFAPACLLLNRDARRMDTKPKPDGMPPDLESRADILVFEVFDSGLIGEGVLHILANAIERLAAEDATLLPCGATVYAQPIQMRTGSRLGLDFGMLNRWRWRPDYEGVDLRQRGCDWVPLAPPREIFAFDFYEREANMRPDRRLIEFTAERDGIANAIAFWFDLHLDADTTLSTSPHGAEGSGSTWQQSVQYIEELRVEEGAVLPVYASHDTFGVSFAVDGTGIDRFAMRTGVPVVDPVWKAQHDKMQTANVRLTRAMAQNPLEYRRVAQAAVSIASRPGDVGVDPGAASDYLKRMMS